VFAESPDDHYDSGINPDSRTKPGWTKIHRRVWLPADGKQNGLLKEQMTLSHGTPVKQAWGTIPLEQPGGGPLGDPNSYTAINQLSRDPDKLLTELHRRYPAGHSSDPARDRTADERVFDGIQGMVAESKEGIREESIFDRRTYAPLGARKVLADARAYDKLFADLKGVLQGQTLSLTALLSTRIVDHPEQLS
jgi:hypothetical protein